MPEWPALRRMVKRHVKSAFQRAGLEIHRTSRQVGAVEALSRIAENSNCSMVLDVGANEGEFVQELRSHGYYGDVISFEPREAAFRRLEQRTLLDPRWVAKRVALGATRGNVQMNISDNGVSSSVLPMQSLHLEAEPDAAYVATEEVAQDRLDELVLPLLGEGTSLLLKLDVQGYEAAVLAGAPKILERTVALQLELSPAPVYDGQTDWRELTLELQRLGFEFWALESVLADKRTGRTLQIDAVMRRHTLPHGSV